MFIRVLIHIRAGACRVQGTAAKASKCVVTKEQGTGCCLMHTCAGIRACAAVMSHASRHGKTRQARAKSASPDDARGGRRAASRAVTGNREKQQNNMGADQRRLPSDEQVRGQVKFSAKAASKMTIPAQAIVAEWCLDDLEGHWQRATEPMKLHYAKKQYMSSRRKFSRPQMK